MLGLLPSRHCYFAGAMQMGAAGKTMWRRGIGAEKSRVTVIGVARAR